MSAMRHLTTQLLSLLSRQKKIREPMTPKDDIVADEATTTDDFLGGAVKLIQPVDGYRVSMDTVLLAASIPAKRGDKVLEGGVGSAGAAICLAQRVPGVKLYGIEIQADMLALGKQNVVQNSLEKQVSLSEGCITDLSGPQSGYDHVMLNPPYLPAGKAIRPPSQSKGIAHMDGNASLKDWVRFAVHNAKQKGTVTIVHRADRLDELLAHLYRRVGELKILPLWPREGRSAKRVIVQGRKGVHGATSILPGLALHGDTERYTAEAHKILWHGEALDLKAFARTAQSS